MAPRLVTTTQAADILGVTPETVRSFARRGKLRIAMHPPNGFLFDAREVERLAKRRQQGNA